jgi:hypothetical protein
MQITAVPVDMNERMNESPALCVVAMINGLMTQKSFF